MTFVNDLRNGLWFSMPKTKDVMEYDTKLLEADDRKQGVVYDVQQRITGGNDIGFWLRETETHVYMAKHREEE